MFLASFYVLGPFDKSWLKLAQKLAQISIQITKINLVWFLIYFNVLFVEPFHYYIY